MRKKTFRFSSASVDYYFDAKFSLLKQIVDVNRAVIITDEKVFQLYENRFQSFNTIVVQAGEQFKIQATVSSVVDQLIQMHADRTTTIVGVGGGVITDLTGFIASIYMRGISFGFLPTTLLGLVDASIGGKNGIDVGVYKNMVGCIRQPSFILHDLSFLKTLPENEWRNGFAEIIKHAAIKDAAMFKELEANSIESFWKKKARLADLVWRNTLLKTKLVQQDEFEKGDRKLLNFGHTLGHALENQSNFSHGEAISVGMAAAAGISEKLTGFKGAKRLVNLLDNYGLPTVASFDKEKVMDVLKMDKKKTKNSVSYILLDKIGKATIKEIPFEQLYQLL